VKHSLLCQCRAGLSGLWGVAIVAVLLTGCQATNKTVPVELAPMKAKPVIQADAPDLVMKKASQAGLPEVIQSWKLVRYVPGEHAHFLYAKEQKSFSLFVTQMGTHDIVPPASSLKEWKQVSVAKGKKVYIHHDSRDSEKSAVVWKHGSQRRMMVGNMQESSLLALSALLY
jgi:hypothetical protein